MLGGAMAGDPFMMPADIRRVRGDMGDAGLFPEGDFAPPILFAPGAGRDPDLEPELRRVAPGLPRQHPQFLERRERLLPGRVAQRHEAVAVVSGTAKGRLGMAAKPDRHAPRS